MPVPQNAQAIWSFLKGQGFSDNAAAGIEGNMEQESGGNPHAGSNPPGAGLIQILGDPGGDLQSELQKTMDYIRQNGSVADINANSSSATSAALYFSQKYERPGIPDNANRMQSASDVLNAAKSGHWPSSGGSSSGGGGGGGGSSINPLNPATWFPSIFGSLFGSIEKPLADILERGALIVFGAILILIGIYRMTSGKPQNVFQSSDNNKSGNSKEDEFNKSSAEANYAKAAEAAPLEEAAEVAAI